MKIDKILRIAVLEIGILFICSQAFADTQDYAKGNVILIKSGMAYFDVGKNDGVGQGQNFEIYTNKRILTTGRIGWADNDISRSEPLDSTSLASLSNIRPIYVKIRLYVSQAREGGFLGVAYFTDLHLEPSTIMTSDDRMVARLIHRGLIEKTPDGQFVPDICRDYEIRDLSYTFHLNPAIKFQLGKSLVAEDVVYSLEQLARAPRLTASSCFILEIDGVEQYRHGIKNEIQGIHVIDDSTLAITLRRPFPTFEDYLAGPAGYIIPKPSIAPFGAEVIGAGPYKIKWHDDNGIALEPAVFSGNDAKCDSLRFLRYTSADEAGLALDLVRVDIVALLGVPSPKLISRRNYFTQNQATLSNVIIGINARHFPGESQAVGKALSFLLNRGAIIRVILGGSGAPPVFYAQDESNSAINLSLPNIADSAEYYLDSLGLRTRNLTLYVDSDYPILSKVARFIEGQLQSKNIRISEKKFSYLTIDESAVSSDLDLYLTCNLAVSGNPDCIFYPILSDSLSGQTNLLFTQDEALQAFLDNLHIETDFARRDIIASSIAQSVASEPPVVFLYQPALTTITRMNITGVVLNRDGYLDLRDVSLKDAR